MNKSIFIGRVCQELQIKTVGGDHKVCNFSVAVQSKKKDANGKYLSIFINCAAWDKKAEYITSKVGKGDKVYVDGYFDSNQYTDKNGSKITTLTLMVENFESISTPRDRENTVPQSVDAFFKPDEGSDFLPFDL